MFCEAVEQAAVSIKGWEMSFLILKKDLCNLMSSLIVPPLTTSINCLRSVNSQTPKVLQFSFCLCCSTLQWLQFQIQNHLFFWRSSDTV